MPRRFLPERARWLAARALGGLVLLASALALLPAQLALDLHAPGLRVAPATAGLLTAAAAGLLLVTGPWNRCAAGLAAALALAAAGSLAEHFVSAGHLPSAAPWPRVPATTAFALVLLGGGMAALGLSRRLPLAGQFAQGFAGTAILFTALALARPDWLTCPLDAWSSPGERLGYLCLMLLGAAVLLAVRDPAPDEGGHQVDRFLAWVPVLMLGLVFIGWVQLEQRDWREHSRDAAMARDTIVADITSRLKTRSDALQRLTERWQADPHPTRRQWERDASSYLRDFPPLHALIHAGPDYIVRWRVARPGSPNLIGASLELDDGRLTAFHQARETGMVHLSRVIQLRSGGSGLVLVGPVWSGSQFQGYITASMRANDLLEVAQTPALRNFSAKLRDTHGVVAGEAGDPVTGMSSLVQTTRFDALGHQWTLEVWPKPDYLLRMQSRLPEAVFLLGVLAVALVLAALFQFRRATLNFAAAQRFSRRLTDTLESITDGFFTLDKDWRFSYLNAEAERLLNRNRGELLGRVVWSEFPEAVGSSYQHHYERARSTGISVVFEEYYPPLDRWFSVRAFPTPEGIAVYFQDVTLHVRNRHALLESERELRALAESMPQMLWMARPDGFTTYFNQRWLAYSGLGLEESYGDRWIHRIHPEDTGAMEQTWRRSRDGVEGFSIECRLRRKDGCYRWMLLRAVPLRDTSGQLLKWMGTFTDIDEIKVSTQALRVSEERFRLLSRASNDAIWDCELATGAMWCSDSFLSQFGQGQDLEGWSRRIHPEDRGRALEILHAAMAEGRDVWSADYRFERADGQWAHILDRGYVIRDELGKPRRLVCGMSDITNRVRLEEQLRQSQKLESIGQLTGGLAHDFNNLLTVILGNAEVLADALAGDEANAQLAQMVVSAAERGAELTQRLLAFGRQQALAPIPVDLHRQLVSLEPLLRRTLGAHIDIRLNLAPALWNAMVDPAQLDNALLNLCLNARDAMPEGGRLTLEAVNTSLSDPHARRYPDLVPGRYVLLKVSDSGRGIAPEHLGRLFEPFFTTKEIGKGTGLGLPMVYGFIKQSGGQIDIASEPGSGTTVQLFLPYAAGEPAASRTVAGAPPPMSTGSESILLVEDDGLVRDHASRQLRALGYSVSEATDAGEALAILEGPDRIDLLFTDVVMPGGSGPRLVALAQQVRPDLKVLYTSGYTGDPVIHRERIDPGIDVLPKPYSREQLARQVRIALHGGSAASDGAGPTGAPSKVPPEDGRMRALDQ